MSQPKLFGRMLGATLGFLAIVAISTLLIAKVTPAHAWSGCGVAVYGGHSSSDFSLGGPVSLSVKGQLPGASALCDLAIGQSIVVGAFAGAEKAFGDLDDVVGINHAWDVGMRAGFLIHPSVLLYGHAAWTRMDVSLLGSIDGWKWGPGLEVKLPASNWSVDMRYQISDMDVGTVIGPGVEMEGRTFRLGLVYKIGGGKELESAMAPVVQQDPAPAPAPKAKAKR